MKHHHVPWKMRMKTTKENPNEFLIRWDQPQDYRLNEGELAWFSVAVAACGRQEGSLTTANVAAIFAWLINHGALNITVHVALPNDAESIAFFNELNAEEELSVRAGRSW